MKQRLRGRKRGLRLGLAGFLVAFSSGLSAFGWTDDAKMAAVDVANGEASPEAQRLAFENNQAINRMGARGTEQGGLSKTTYQANQKAFTAKNNELIRNAAHECGLDVEIKEPKGDPLAGTDTDVNVKTRDGKPLTYDQWKKLNETYNAKVNEYLQKPPGSKVETGTDLMPDAKTTSPEDFHKITTEINNQGGTAYTDPAAARVEGAMAKGEPIVVNEVGGYVKELQGQANTHFEQAAKTTAEANSLAKALGENHPQVQDLRAKAQIENSQGAKYVDKITEVGGKLREQAGLPPLPEGQNPPPSSGLTDALRNNRGADTIAQSEQIGPLSKNALNNATQSTIDNLAEVAKANPEAAPACQEAIANSLRDLPMSQKGQAMEALKAKYGNDFAKGVASAAQGPGATPGAQVMKGFDKAMKVIGPGLMIYDGVGRIKGALNAPDEAKTYVAGKAIGGFVGGLAGAMGAAAVVGGLIVAAPATVLGAAAVIGAGVVAGAVGYGVGDYAGSSLAGWMLEGVRPRDQSEYDAMAAKGLLDGSKDVYGQLIACGVDPAVAQAAADAYKRGDVKTFKEILAAVRAVLVKNPQKGPPRRFQDLPNTEVQRLLDCLCSASLGAAMGVAQGYNTNIPPGSKGYSCGDLGNGPCMASGFGCWRSFIRWSNPGIADCLASFNLPTNTGFVRGQIDAAYQKPYEKPFKAVMKVEPVEVCPGDQVTVTFVCEGGRGDNQFRYEIGWPLKPPENAPTLSTWGGSWCSKFSSASSMTFTVPELRRGFYDGQWIYERPAEAYPTYIRGVAQSTTFDPYSGQEVPVTVFQDAGVRLRTHAECEKLHPPPPPEAKKPPKKPEPPTKTTTKTTSSTQSSGASGAGSSGSSAGGGTGSSVHSPPTSTAAGGGGTSPSSPKTTAPTAGGQSSSPPSSHAPGNRPPPASEPPKTDGTSSAGATATGSNDCASCLQIGGSSEGSGTSVTDSAGQTTAGTQASATYWVEGCPGQKVRLSVTGSDGWTGSAEGENQRATVTRPLGMATGTDEVTAENLGIPGCSKTVQIPFGPPPELATNLENCATLSGGASGQETSITEAGGQTTGSSEASSWYRVEGPAGTQVKITATGSDGWSGSAEGSGAAMVTHPFAVGKSGTDSIVYENLSIPGCRKTAEIPFGVPDDLKGAEAPSAGGAAAGAKPTAVLDGYAATTAGKADQNATSGLSVMSGNLGLQDASNVGNQTIDNAKRTVDSAGYDAQDVGNKSQQKIRVEDGKDAHVFGDAILNGVGSGLQQAGQQFGAGMGSHVAGEIFDSHVSKSGGGSGPEAKAGGSGAPSAGSPAGGGSSSSVGGGKKKPGGSSGSSGSGGGAGSSGSSGGSNGQIMADALCPICGQMYNPADGHQCPGAGGGGEILADALCPVCGQMYNPAVGHQCPGASQEPPKTVCDICGRSPASSVSTVDGGTKNMCSACQGSHRCPRCGKYAMEFHSQGYGYEINNPDGTTSTRHGSIEGVCANCIEDWKKENGLP